jgi:hypothetical protein
MRSRVGGIVYVAFVVLLVVLVLAPYVTASADCQARGGTWVRIPSRNTYECWAGHRIDR